MQRVGQTIVEDRQAIIDLLESAEIDMNPNASDLEISDAYLYYLPENDSLKYGTAYLIELKDKSSFDGSVSNESIYKTYDKLYDYWDVEDPDDYEDYADEEEDKSNVLGLVGGIVSGGLGVANKVIEGKQKQKYGALDYAQKQAEAQQALLSGIMAQKQAQLQAQQKADELKAKKRKTTIIVTASVIGVLAIITAVVYLRSKAKT
jgi:hypothetical protein